MIKTDDVFDEVAEAEVERLRDALVTIANGKVFDAQGFARRTLEGLSREDALDPTEYLKKLTCYGCGARATCEFVDDGWNTNGDCLAEK